MAHMVTLMDNPSASQSAYIPRAQPLKLKSSRVKGLDPKHYGSSNPKA